MRTQVCISISPALAERVERNLRADRGTISRICAEALARECDRTEKLSKMKADADEGELQAHDAYKMAIKNVYAVPGPVADCEIDRIRVLVATGLGISSKELMVRIAAYERKHPRSMGGER